MVTGRWIASRAHRRNRKGGDHDSDKRAEDDVCVGVEKRERTNVFVQKKKRKIETAGRQRCWGRGGDGGQTAIASVTSRWHGWANGNGAAFESCHNPTTINPFWTIETRREKFFTVFIYFLNIRFYCHFFVFLFPSS